MKKILFLAIMAFGSVAGYAQEELIKFGNFEQWISRDIQESKIIGGDTKTLMEIGPNAHWKETKAYTNQGGSPWATSNVYAKVMGIVKTNSSVYRDSHNGGSCAKMVTHIEKVKVAGMVNIEVLAAGSVFTGNMIEPITGTSNPMSKMNMGYPFTKRPKAIKLDYKVTLTGDANRIKQTGFSKVTTVKGMDMPEMVVILQARTEDAKGNIQAKRVATIRHRFNKATAQWEENKEFPLNYGNITTESWYQPYMGLLTGDQSFYATNSKGKQVKIVESWGTGDETPTHAIVKFDSSHGGAYIGSIGTTLCIDNVRWVY